MRISRLVLGFAEQVQARQGRNDDENVDENVLGPEDRKEDEILHLDSEYLSNGGELRIIGKCILTELNDWQCTQQDEANVEHEGRHVCLANLHGMDLHEHEADPKLEASLESADQQVGRKDRHRQYAKEWKPRIEPQKVGVEKRREWRIGKYVDDGL